MRLKIKKMVLREEWVFIFEVTPNNLACTFRLQGRSEILQAEIEPTFSHILLKKPLELYGYVNGMTSEAPKRIINKIKLSKENKIKVQEYNQ